jgi:hypothetical protein
VPIAITHPSFILWWQELHDHIFNVPVHPLCLELMFDFHPTSEVYIHIPFIHLPSFMALFTDQDFVIFCRIWHLPHLPGQSPIILKVQSLP